MGQIFAGSEIVEMGIQIEINGRDFYNTLARQSKDQKVKELFKYLADEEAKHIAAFQEILKSVQQYEPPESYPPEYFAYMNALASEHVFTQKDKAKEITRDIKTDKEAVDKASGFEEASVIFYEGMKKLMRERDLEIADKLIAQEQEHIKKLSALKGDLN